jgi:hypothetical protein
MAKQSMLTNAWRHICVVLSMPFQRSENNGFQLQSFSITLVFIQHWVGPPFEALYGRQPHTLGIDPPAAANGNLEQ